MFTHVVLLRGVNVGKARRVPMAAFRELLFTTGCREVSTLLNSGNAVVAMPGVTPGALARQVSAAIRDALGLDVPVVVKSIRELREIVLGNRLLSGCTDASRLLVVFTQTRTHLKALASVAATVNSPEQFVLGEQAAYVHCPNGILRCDVARALQGWKGSAVTTRNWATVLKLHGLSAVRSPAASGAP